MAPVVKLESSTDEFINNLADDLDSYQYWFWFFGISELFGPNWSYISAAFCFWNEDFCRSAGAFAVS
jgi:hypothetical protein